MADPRKKIFPMAITSYVDTETKEQLRELQDLRGLASEAETLRYLISISLEDALETSV